MDDQQMVIFPRALLLLAVVALDFAQAGEPKPAQTWRVPMRDGIRLATDIYLPAGQAERLPCLLMRTPYGRERYNQEVGSMAEWGYAVAIQDTRGRFDSEGKAMAFASDGWGELQDGYDTVEWLAGQEFCDGRVGTLGASAMGIAQALLAPAAPPHLVCQYISVAPGSLYHEANYVGGVLRENQVVNYLEGHAHPDALREVLSHTEYHPYWEKFDAERVAHRVRVPAIHYGGWFDTFSEGTIRNFLARQTRGGSGARGEQKLVMGPWTHGGPGKVEFGDFTLPAAARSVPWDVSARRWFDFWLKGRSNGVGRLPSVIYYVMGPMDGEGSSGNVWRTAESWPVPARELALFLAPQGELSVREAGGLSKLSFRHDPAHPVPTAGGRNLYLPAGPRDQRAIESRSDVLVFTSRAVAEDVEVTGPVKARLYLSQTGRPQQVAVRLCDVYPDGRSILICEGIQRANPSGSAGEKPVSVLVDLWSTSLVFARGHCIRVSVAGSNHPRWSVGPVPPGTAVAPAEVRTLWMGGESASRLLLPVVRGWGGR